MKPKHSASLLATIAFLTTFPTPSCKQHAPPSLLYMPLVGLILGLLLWACAMLLSATQPMVLTFIVLCLWLASTGFLHVDGLADVIDGLAASHQDKRRDNTQLLQVMQDPHIGSFAVAGLIVLLLGKFVLLLSLFFAGEYVFLLLIPAWARLGAAWWAESLPALSNGLAAWCKQAGQAYAVIWTTILLCLSLIFSPILLLAPLVLWAWHAFLQRKFGGMNGDCLGAGIEVCELSLLLLCCLVL